MGYSRFKVGFLLVIMLLGNLGICYAQTLGEFFNQKKKQQQYLLQQIAALQVYIGYAKKGYEIVDDGLQTVKDFTNGEFKLHDAFISSLKQVSPAIRNNAKIAEIISLQLAIVKAFASVKSSTVLSAPTLLYIAGVKENVMEEFMKDLEELLMVITSGKLDMGDEERLQRLDKVYASMRDKSAFVQDFVGNIHLLIHQKNSELNHLNLLKKHYEND